LTIIALLPLHKIVTTLLLAQSFTTKSFSYIVPNTISSILPARPNFSGLISSNLGIILPPVAIAKSSTSPPATHLTANKSFYNKR